MRPRDIGFILLSGELQLSDFNDDSIALRVGSLEELEDGIDKDFSEMYDRVEAGEIVTAMSILTERERAVLGMRFGLDGRPAMTLDQVGGRIGVSRESIRIIEAKALAKLRGEAARKTAAFTSDNPLKVSAENKTPPRTFTEIYKLPLSDRERHAYRQLRAKQDMYHRYGQIRSRIAQNFLSTMADSQLNITIFRSCRKKSEVR